MVEREGYGTALEGGLVPLKEYLRIEGGDEDGVLGRLLASAMGVCEAFTAQLWIARGVVEVLPADESWRRLASTPVTAIDAVEGVDVAGTAMPLATDGFATEIDAAGDGWLRVIDSGGARRVRVTLSAGSAADWSALPEPVAQGLIRLAAHFHAHRDGIDDRGPPAAVTALWRPWRRMRIA